MQLDLKPSVWSFLTVGLMAVVFISLAKWAANKWPVPGVSDVINSV